MRKYEIMYILKPDLEKEAVAKVNEKLANVLKKQGANVLSVDEWGLRDLAYEIKKVNKGYYVVLEIETEGNAALAEFRRVSNLDANVLRFLITKAHEGEPAPKKEAEKPEEAKDNQ